MNHSFILFFSFLLFPFLRGIDLHETSPKIFSDDVYSDGQHLLLKGHVRVYDALGVMQAYEADLEKKKQGQTLSKLLLKKDVFLSFQDETTLLCDEALIDFISCKGHALSFKRPTFYRSLWKPSKKPFSISSERIDFTFSQNEEKKRTLETLTAYKKVVIRYDEMFHLQCDRAVLANEKLNTFSNASSNCSLTHFDKTIEAKNMQLNLHLQTLEMKIVQGKIPSFVSKNPLLPSWCFFSAKKMIWNDRNHTILLESDVTFSDIMIGSLNTDNKLLLSLQKNPKKPVIQTIQTFGETTLIMKEENSHEIDQLKCFGTLKLDPTTFVLKGNSPQTKGKVLLTNQLLLKKKDTTFYADRLDLKYHLSQGSFKPLSMHLEGNVRFISKDLPFQYGLADEAHYDPKAHEMLFLSKHKKEALFWHKKENYILSADQLLISLDPMTKKEKIEGIGVVRLSSQEKEKLKLHRFFPNAVTLNQETDLP